MVVVHGMGQHQRYTTQLQMLRLLERSKTEESVKEVTGRVVDDPDEAPGGLDRILRVLVRRDDAGTIINEIDVYELYWAPLTTGKITLRQVLAWLVRQTFGASHQFGKASWAGVRTAKIAVGVVIVLGFLLLAIGTGLASLWFTLTAVGEFLAGRPQTEFTDLRSVLETLRGAPSLQDVALSVPTLIEGFLVLAPLAALGAVLAYVVWQFLYSCLMVLKSPFRNELPSLRDENNRLLGNGESSPRRRAAALGLLLAVLFLTASLLMFSLDLREPLWPIPLDLSLLGSPGRWLGEVTDLDPVWRAAIGVWFLWAVRRVVVSALRDSFGDVVAYVERDEHLEMYNARREIMQRGFDLTTRILGLKVDDDSQKLIIDEEVPAYRRVVFVAHSLGSVIALDVLRQLWANIPVPQEGTSEGDPKKVRERLSRAKGLLTVGSPLGLISYVYGRRDPDEDTLGALFTSRLQEVLQGVKWINLLYWMDPVATYLKDSPRYRGRVDKDKALGSLRGWIPIVSHTVYLKDNKVGEEIWPLILPEIDQ